MYDVIIIGSGPSGLMAAIMLKNKKVLLIEKNSTSGKKLLLTGNSRCNITNLKDNNIFLENIFYNKKYLYSTINNFGPKDIYNFFTKNNVPLKIEKEDKVFPKSDSSVDILNCLLSQISHPINYNETVLNITINKDNTKTIITDKNSYVTKKVIIATGGVSFPQTGSTGDGLKFAQELNQPIVPIFPAETGIILKNKTNLEGTSFDEVLISYLKYKSIGNLIFTHKGLGGTAIMKMSEYIYKNSEKEIFIDFLPDLTREEFKNNLICYDREKTVNSYLAEYFTKKFSLYLTSRLNLNSNKVKSLTDKDIDNIFNTIKKIPYTVEAVGDIKTAYVTGGGIDMKYIDSRTMESNLNKGVYFVGEALDIHGPIGGYNLTLALSTGYTAGKSI